MTAGHGVDPRTYAPQDELYLWALVNPARPVPVGSLRLSQLVPDCATFAYGTPWWHFPLSEDLPILAGHTFTAGEKGSAPGAIDDARPDRWGERIVRHIDRPQRLSVLEMLLFAGDDRFGALGVSVSAEQYLPRALGPYPRLRDLGQLSAAIDDMQVQAPVTAAMQRLLQPGVTLGGARPKALLHTDAGPCVVKFSELDDAVDTPLVEHATMALAARAGIGVAATGVLPLPERHGRARHALTIQRFDREGPYRLHCLSARTALRAAGLDERYGALATVLLRLGHPDRQAAQREELFKRMVFNILMDNTDDHERNHSLRLGFDGYYELTPAYDVVPTLQNLGYQAMAVGTAGAESSLDNALTELSEFGIRRPRATELVQQVARTVDGWEAHFTRHGVCAGDLDLLRASIDRPALRQQRKAFC
ncbi:HipA domain-containing protein [Acidovorax sp. GBBC 3334]|uniref:type II toxin-antitoxin system HipA family toxin n=1 Tax=unclassified Acidovorax TaxID=2684926 RepID=UPI0023039BBC|nr:MULTISPECIES: HipA domain-containing protein [unclassified Acidovorax]MDA8457089.1 HipA domain-containing protein [Acidovorax sp. GBBC 3334]MDA8522047.1 HipA domain-containing protein [Acidovorax sp. NCPPB 4044]